jgi:(p)ppGpp synthase/HD superfamily hydrolase
MEATTDDSEGRIEMTLEVNDMRHLERVIKSLRGVDGVLAVERAVR